jgi:amino acid permease
VTPILSPSSGNQSSNAQSKGHYSLLPDALLSPNALCAYTPAGMNEMVTYLPISSPFIRFAGRYVDEAFGFAAGYNFFVFEAALVPFEIVACNVIIQYWSSAVPVGVIIAIVIVLYA